MKVNIQVGSLVLLSGPSGSGKSTVCKQIAKDYHPTMILSSDALRNQFYGSRPIKEGLSPQAVDDRLIFKVMKEVTHSRLKEGLTTFIDATLLSDKARGDFIKIAQDFNCPYLVLIFDLSREELHQRNQSRKEVVPKEVVDRQIEKYQQESRYPFVRDHYFEISIDPYQIPDENKLDVIGDVHGMKQELDQLLAAMGYQWRDNKLKHSQDSKRVVLFLGDLTDRGYDSLGVLKLVMKAVSSGHYCLLGNHDLNLLRGLEEGTKPRSLATQKTLHQILTQCDKNEIRAIESFLKRLPPYYLHQETAYVHADIEWFDPYLTPKHDLIKGFSKLHQPHNTDQVYEALFERGDNTYRLVRGHIPPTGERTNLLGYPVSALEAGQAFAGKLVSLTANHDLAEVDCSHYTYSPDH